MPDCLCGGGQKKHSGCTHSVTIAGMLAEPIRLLRTFYERITHILLDISREVKDILKWQELMFLVH